MALVIIQSCKDPKLELLALLRSFRDQLRSFRDPTRKFVRGSQFLKDDSGSLAVIVIGLFIITVASLMVMTDVSTVIVAKRSLAQATEAAAQRGVHTLDKANYYHSLHRESPHRMIQY